MKRMLALGIAAGGLVTAVTVVKRMRAVPAPDAPGRTIEVAGAKVHLVDKGSGDPILLVHGFGGNTFSWRDVQPLLAANHRTVAVDLPGFGFSDRDPNVGLGHNDQADRLAALLDVLGLPSAVVIGHSMGGAIAQRLAIRHPGKVQKLVLAASVDASVPPAWRGRRRGRMPVGPAARAFSAVPGAVPFIAGQGLRRMAYDPSTITPEVVRGYSAPLCLPGTVACLEAMTRDTAAEEPADLSAMTAPTLVVSGETDRAFPVEYGAALAAKIRGARQVVLPRTGHLAPEERPEAFVEEVVAFLTEPVSAGV